MPTPKHNPATPLPWQDHSPHGENIGKGVVGTHYGRFQVPSRKDAAYIVHACNAYPKLIEALKAQIKVTEGMAMRGDDLAPTILARQLLHSLGEDQ